MKKIFLVLFFFSSAGCWADGGGQGTKGHGGGKERLEKFMGAFAGKVDAKNLFLRQMLTTDYLGNEDHLDCGVIQTLMGFGANTLAFLDETGFVFRDAQEKRLHLDGFDRQKILAAYQDPRNCVDLRGHANVDPLTVPAKVVLLPLNTMDERKDLMGLNRPDLGKIFFFTDNWKSAKVLEAGYCHIEVASSYQKEKQKDDLAFLADNAELKKACLFLTEVAVAAHEVLSVGGIKEEQNNRYDFSSLLLELLSVNLDQLRPRAQAFFEHLGDYFTQASRDLLNLRARSEERQKTAMKIAGLRVEDQDFKSYLDAYADTYLASKRLTVSYLEIMYFLDLVLPKTLEAHLLFSAYSDQHYFPRPEAYFSLSPEKFFDLEMPDFLPNKNKAIYNRLLKNLFIMQLAADQTHVLNDYQMGQVLDRMNVHTQLRYGNRTADEIKTWHYKKFPGF